MKIVSNSVCKGVVIVPLRWMNWRVGVLIDDYVNADNYIKASYFYTSKGVNSFEPSPYFTYDSVMLSKGGDFYG